MLSVGLTGGVAAGKSLVSRVWAEAGVPVVDADRLARDVVEPGTPGLEQVRAAFGDGVITADGSLDREALRSVAFADDEARARLEAILHPLIGKARREWLEERAGEGELLVVSEIPLLFETGAQSRFDVTVVVTAPDDERVRRLVDSRGLAEEEARRILAAQMPQAEKQTLADIVIENGGTVAEVEAEALRVLETLRERAGVRSVRLDLHLHTSASWDCLSDPEAVLERALALGYDRIAITDHDRLSSALRLAEAHPERVIPGEEVKTAEGIDVIGLYLSEEIPGGTPARETIERIRSQGGIPYLPHPYARGKGGGGRMADELASLCDVVEVFNARLHDAAANRRAEDLARRHAKRPAAGSDAHTLGELGNAWVEVPSHPNRPDALLAALRCGRTGGREASRLVHLASTWAKVRTTLPGGGR
jgi:dephospho-CoA kinase